MGMSGLKFQSQPAIHYDLEDRILIKGPLKQAGKLGRRVAWIR